MVNSLNLLTIPVLYASLGWYLKLPGIKTTSEKGPIVEYSPSAYLYLVENLGSFCSNKNLPTSSKPTFQSVILGLIALTKPTSDIDSISILTAV